MKLLAIAVLAAASIAGAQDLAGEYVASMPEMASGLMLRSDRTFEFFFTYGAADYTGKGTWRLEGGDVVLTSTTADAPPFRLIRSGKGPHSGIRVHVVAPNGQGVEHMDVTVTGSGVMRARTSSEGYAEFSGGGRARSVSIHVPVYDVQAGPFSIDAAQNEFWFEINGPAITDMKFRDERLRRAGDSLEMRSSKFGLSLKFHKQ